MTALPREQFKTASTIVIKPLPSLTWKTIKVKHITSRLRIRVTSVAMLVETLLTPWKWKFIHINSSIVVIINVST